MNINSMLNAQNKLRLYKLVLSEKDGYCYVYNRDGQVVIKLKTNEELNAFVTGVTCNL